MKDNLKPFFECLRRGQTKKARKYTQQAYINTFPDCEFKKIDKYEIMDIEHNETKCSFAVKINEEIRICRAILESGTWKIIPNSGIGDLVVAPIVIKPGLIRDLSYANISRWQFNFSTQNIERAKKMLLYKFEEYGKPHAVTCNLIKNKKITHVIDYAPYGDWRRAHEKENYKFKVKAVDVPIFR